MPIELENEEKPRTIVIGNDDNSQVTPLTLPHILLESYKTWAVMSSCLVSLIWHTLYKRDHGFADVIVVYLI